MRVGKAIEAEHVAQPMRQRPLGSTPGVTNDPARVLAQACRLDPSQGQLE